ncbi:hypothetical protein N431DRAFT_501450 [Stipitochalara longipes BDJ]|nr:hypothetical protein N431DRAFT_501450 [Stipitochalara longipes BDJ]
MFDKSFARSKLYFTTLQLLRIFSDMIRETGRELRDTSEYFFSEKFYLKMRSHWGGPENIQDLVESWKGILSLHQAAEEKLLDRIQSKTAEIESLRERLFNATSVRETSRSTSMNRAVIVFTIVTVTYLPASFIATIFGTQLFNDEDIAGTINKFKITTIVVSITTFVLAILLVLLAANLHRIKRSSIYRKWNGKMHQHGKVMENDETRSRGEELSNRRRDQVPQGRLQSLRNRFRQRPKKNENP